MAATFTELVLDSHDPERLSQFWQQVLGWERMATTDDGEIELKGSGGGPSLLFVPTADNKIVKNRLHLDLRPVGTTRDEEVDRIVALGATPVDIGQGEVSWVVLADPEGNEFCILRGG